MIVTHKTNDLSLRIEKKGYVMIDRTYTSRNEIYLSLK